MILESFKEKLNETTVPTTDNMELESVYENEFNYYINDYIIFEATLRRDFLECLGILTEDGDKNFLQKIWDKIKEVMKNFVDKLKRLIESFRQAIAAFKHDRAQALLEHYKPYFDKGKDKLKDFTIKKFRLNLEAIDELDKIFDKYNDDALDINKINSDSSEEAIKAAIEKLDNIKTEDLKNEINKTLYSEQDITNPFASNINGMVADLVNIISEKVEDIYEIKETKRNCEATNKELIKVSKKSIKDFKKDDKMDKDAKEKAIKQAQTYLQYLNKCQKVTINLTSLCLNAVSKYTKEATRLYVAAGKYLKKELAKKDAPAKEDKPAEDNKEEAQNASYISTEYNDIVSEAVAYELY